MYKYSFESDELNYDVTKVILDNFHNGGSIRHTYALLSGNNHSTLYTTSIFAKNTCIGTANFQINFVVDDDDTVCIKVLNGEHLLHETSFDIYTWEHWQYEVGAVEIRHDSGYTLLVSIVEIDIEHKLSRFRDLVFEFGDDTLNKVEESDWVKTRWSSLDTITELSLRAELYRVDNNSVVLELRSAHGDIPTFVTIDNLDECLSGWKLKSIKRKNGSYTITFTCTNTNNSKCCAFEVMLNRRSEEYSPFYMKWKESAS